MPGTSASQKDNAGLQQSRVMTIANQRGLHARAAAKFAEASGKYNAQITVSRSDIDDSPTVNGSSILGLMMLAAEMGAHIKVDASGTDATQALDSIEVLVKDKFGEGE